MVQTGPKITHLVQFSLLAGKREGEAQGKLFILDPHLLQKISQTVSYVVKQLQEKRKEVFFSSLLIKHGLKTCAKIPEPSKSQSKSLHYIIISRGTVSFPEVNVQRRDRFREMSSSFISVVSRQCSGAASERNDPSI